jgi:hypothetical protein
MRQSNSQRPQQQRPQALARHEDDPSTAMLEVLRRLQVRRVTDGAADGDTHS